MRVSRKKVLVQRRRYVRTCKDIAEANEIFCERGGTEKFRLCNELLKNVEPFSDEYCELVHIRDVQGYIADAIMNQHTEAELLLYKQRNGGDDDKR